MDFKIKDKVLIKCVREEFSGEAVIPDDVEVIGNKSFTGRDKIKSISIPDSVVRIGINAFADCINLESINIPESVTEIGSGAFRRCIKLTDISIPKTVSNIGASAFSGTAWLESHNEKFVVAGNNVLIKYNGNDENVIIPQGIKVIGESVFCCKNMRSVSIPDSVEYIGNSAFFDCENLESVTVPESVKCIGSQVFAGCINLKTAHIPDSVSERGVYVFADCTSLDSIMRLKYTGDSNFNVTNGNIYSVIAVEKDFDGKDVYRIIDNNLEDRIYSADLFEKEY